MSGARALEDGVDTPGPAAAVAGSSEPATGAEVGLDLAGTQAVLVGDGAWTLLHRGLALADPATAAEQARAAAASVGEDIRWVVLAGLGAGHLLVELCRTRPELHVLGFEPSPPVLEALRLVPAVRACLMRERVSVATSAFALRDAFQARYVPGEGVKTFTDAIVAALAPAAVREALEVVLQSRRRLESNLLSQVAVNELWVEHLLANLPSIATLPTVDELSGPFRGLPAFVVAAGPSLERNVDELVGADQLGLVIAVGTALSALARQHVEPHLGVAIEWREAALGPLRGVELDRVHLVLSAVAHPGLYALPAAGRFVEIPGGDVVPPWVGESLGVRTRLEEGGSVAHTAFSLAVHLGCDPIVLVGQDLALGEGGRTHAAGTVYEHVRHVPEPAELGRSFWLPGYHGGRVETRRDLYCYHAWFEDRIRGLAGAGPRVVNATEGGARILGAVQQPLAEVVAGMERAAVDVRALLGHAAAGHRPHGSVDLRARLERSIAGAASVERLARHGLRELARLSRPDPRRRAAAGGRLDQIDRELAQQLAGEPLLNALTIGARHRFHLDARSGAPDDREEALRWTVDLSRDLYQAVSDAARRVRPRLERARDRLVS